MFNEIEENRPRDMIGKLGSFGQGRADSVSLLTEVTESLLVLRTLCWHVTS